MTDRFVFWDFDGTLAWRPGLWSGCVMEVLDELEADHGIAVERVREGLRNGFPWHSPEHAHPDLCDAELWWRPVHELISLALERAGLEQRRCAAVATAVRERFVDPSVGWQLFDDTLSALATVADAGWRNAVLSNHVPELPELAEALGLSSQLDAVFTSALIGYDKPHPEAFRFALRHCRNPSVAWMVGDNPVADVAGAESVGLPAILVRTPGEALHVTPGLNEAAAIILGS